MSLIHDLYRWFHDRSSRSDERGEYSAGAWQEMVRDKALEFCAPANGRLLEIGCGEGLFLAQAQKKFPDIRLYGIDNNIARLKAAEKRFADAGLPQPNLLLETLPNIPFQDGYFDMIVCINVFFNMPSLDAVRDTFTRIRRVCKDGGAVIFDYRNAANKLLAMKYRLARYYDDTVKDLPLNLFGARDIEKMLSDNGFRKAREAYLPAYFAGTGWMRKIAPIVVIEAKKR